MASTRSSTVRREAASTNRAASVVELVRLVSTLSEPPSGSARGLSGAAAALRKAAVGDPLGTLSTAVLSAAAVFYAAEKGKNPKVRTFHDALVFVSTSFSVGYSDIFARTPIGKLVASCVMTFGPSLSARALDAPERPEKASSETELIASQRALTKSVEALVQALAAKERAGSVDR